MSGRIGISGVLIFMGLTFFKLCVLVLGGRENRGYGLVRGL